MAKSWLRSLSQKLASARVTKTRVKPLDLLQFEDRVTPATVTWDGGANTLNWHDALNWNVDRLPGTDDDVVIPDLDTLGSADKTITVNNTASARSITTRVNLSLTNQSVTLYEGNLNLNGAATLTITISSDGGLFFRSTKAETIQHVTTDSAGTLKLNNGRVSQDTSSGVYHTVRFDTGITVRGTGTINARGTGNWENAGTIVADADVGGGTLTFGNFSHHTNLAGGRWEARPGTTLTINNDYSWSNIGSIVVDNATLNLGGTFTQAWVGNLTRTGGKVNVIGTITGGLTLNDNTGPWNLTGSGTISGGTVITSGSNILTVNTNGGAGGTLDNVTLDGSIDVAFRTPLTIRNDLTLKNNAAISVANEAAITFDNTSASSSQTVKVANMGDTATISLSGGNVRQFGTAHTVTFGTGVTVRGSGIIGQLPGGNHVVGTYRTAGVLSADTSTNGQILTLNDFNSHVVQPGGVWEAKNSATLIVGQDAYWANNGLIRGTAGTIDLRGISNGNLVSNTLSTGTWVVGTNATLRLPTPVNSINSNVTLDSANSNIFVGTTGTVNALAGLNRIMGDGSLKLTNGRAITTSGSFDNAGILAVGSGSKFTSTGTFTQSAGLNTVDGSLTSTANQVQLNGGVLAGTGTITGNVTNSATIRPGGTDTGVLTVEGNYSQVVAGKLEITVGGPTVGSTGYDRLVVSGSATLEGSLDVAFANGFGPTLGQVFTVATFANKVGNFSNVSVPLLHGNPFFTSSTNTDTVTLTTLITAPDLVPAAIVTPAFLTQGDALALRYTVSNASPTTVPSPWTDRFYLSLDPTLDSSDVPIGSYTHTAALASGSSESQTINTTIPTMAAGLYFLLANADADFAVPDSNRANNVRASATTVAVNLDERELTLDQPTVGRIETSNSVDRWFFNAAANTSVNLIALNSAVATGVRYTLRGPAGFVAFSGLTANSDQIVLPSTGVYTLEVSSNGGATGPYSFQINQAATATLSLGVPSLTTLAGSGFTRLFRIDISEPAPLVVRLTSSTPTDRLAVFARVSQAPSRAVNDFEASGGSNVNLDIPLAAPGTTLYLLVSGESLIGPSNITVRVDSLTVAVSSVTPNSFPTDSTAIVQISGVGFTPGSQVELISASGVALPAQSVSVDQSTQLSATFNLTGRPPGSYDVRVTLPGGETATRPGAFHVTPVGAGRLETRLILPAALGRNSPATILVEYANVGTAAMLAPILVLQSADPDDSDKPLLTLDHNQIGQGLWTDTLPAGFAHSQQIYASGATPGYLLPGERMRVPVYYAGLLKPWNLTDTQYEFEVRIHSAGDSTPIDWSASGDIQRPEWIPANAWDAVRANLQAQIGTTWGDYVQMLSRNAAYLRRFDQAVTDVAELYNFELQQAVGRDAIGSITAALDASTPTPGLPLEFSHSFGNTITSRHTLGAFGYGWDSSWQFRLEREADGTLIVHESADSQRRFEPDIRPGRPYFSQEGDPAVMRAVGGEYELTETTGLKTRYAANGQLRYFQDINGNRITASYTDGKLTQLTHSSGATISVAYNPVGLIERLTDSTGRSTTFTYDLVNKLLLSATSPEGTTRYEYSLGNGAARDYALTRVTGPDGLSQYMEYNTRGLLTASFLDGNINRVSFDYTQTGVVTTTDAAGITSRAFFDSQGLLVRTEDAQGRYTVNEYNANRQLVKSTDHLGRTVSYTRCDCGRPKTITDVYGRTILTFTLGGPNNAPTAFTDANGNRTRYTYDAVGNVIAVTYPDGTVERASYDARGNLDVTTNRRGQTVDRTVNAAGQVTREVWSDGVTRDYVYDSRGRLSTATDSAQGTTTLVYDAADRLTKIAYPNGRWLEYSYDAAGRRTRIVDQTGFATNYRYDAAGRLQELTDRNNQRIVLYTYDATGQLTREDKGNGTYTLYGYDTLGRQTSIVHYAPDGSVNSRFSYTFDSAGRRDSQTTIDGTWTYTYDLVDQLIQAVFVSTNPQIPNQDLRYEYDALGNRTRTIVNGTTTGYTANGMNQYTATTDTTFEYDTDGNLIRETGPDGVKQYVYDQLNRLVGVQTPEGIWQYEYDILGNRTAVIQNGVRTEYLIDPAGLGDVVGEYNASGMAIAGFSHGFGLEGANLAGTWGYYDFDTLGSTSGVSSSTGIYVNSYSYDPWGTNLSETEAVANAFEFVGESGVMEETNGLHFMRARFYDANTGRFTSMDPIRLASGQVNMYGYVGNDPVSAIDPTGLKECCDPRVKRIRDEYYEDRIKAVTRAREDLAQKAKVTNISSAASGAVYAALKCTPLGIGLAVANGVISAGIYQVGDFIAQDDLRALQDEKEAYDRRQADLPPCTPNDNPSPTPKPPAVSGTLGATAAPREIDPNEKLGANGYGPQSFIAAGTTIPYRINFENLGPGSIPTPTTPATAPVQRVDVTDQLSPLLDWTTLEFTEFGFGDTVVAVPAGHDNYFTTVGTTQNGQFFNVEVELVFDRDTGFLRASFQAIDPATGLPPEVLVGFLQPEDGSGAGKGHFSFTVKPKAGLPSGTELRNVAEIRFGFQQVIATNQIDPQNPAAGTSRDKEALNTIDAGTPTSAVATLPESTPLTTFPISWGGQDDIGGSGISSYTIYMAIDGGAGTVLFENVTTTTATVTLEAGHTYSFWSQATDNVGHVEAAKTTAEATIRLEEIAPPPVPPAPGRVAVFAFNDTNFNGQFDTGDTGLPDVIVFADLNTNGVQDANEPSAVTGSDGTATLAELQPGLMSIRTVVPAGLLVSTPGGATTTVTVQSGETTAATPFGFRPIDIVPPSITQTVVQTGQAQRSRVNTYSWTFSEATNIPALIQSGDIVRAFRLVSFGMTASGSGDLVTLSASQFRYDAVTRTLSWTLDGLDLSRSLSSGAYEWQIYGSLITDTAGNALNNGQLVRQRFHRLEGDFDGDAAVTTADQAMQNAILGARIGMPTYAVFFDLDGDGIITARDRKALAKLLGLRIQW